MNILDALRNLDPLNDDHWTDGGDPRIDAVKAFLGTAVTRAEIVAAAPDFNREKAARPEELIMNKADEDKLVSENDDGGEVVDSGIGAMDFLIQNADPEVGAILTQFQYSQEALKVNDLQKVLATLDTDGVKTFLAGAEARIVQIEKAKKDLIEYEKSVRYVGSVVKNRLAVLEPPETNDQAIRRYLENQQKIRLAKAATSSAILRAIQGTDINPLSPLDQAMARKTTRGTKRPVWPGLR
jgi:hypothetical protein